MGCIASLSYDPSGTRSVSHRMGRSVPATNLGAQLTADGIPSPTGNAAWGQSTVQWIVKHPNYTGTAYAWAWRPPKHR